MDYQGFGRPYAPDTSISPPSVFSTDDEDLRLLKQMKDEQSELLQQTDTRRKVLDQYPHRPMEQFLTIALDGKFL